MRRLREKLSSIGKKKAQLWPFGVFLVLGAFVADAIRPQPANQAIATGRAAGQIVLIVVGIMLIMIDIARSRKSD